MAPFDCSKSLHLGGCLVREGVGEGGVGEEVRCYV